MSNKEVRFDIYCGICIHKDKKENEEPCSECLAIPVKENSRRPVCFKEMKR